MDVSMNSKRSYLDTLNAGRARRPHTTLEDLNRSLENLEQRLARPHEPTPDFTRERPAAHNNQRFADLPYGRARSEEPGVRRNTSELPSYQAIARDLERVRDQEDGVAAFGGIAGELKSLREDLRLQVASGMRREFDMLRRDIERVQASGAAKNSDELALEFERLSGAIHSLSDRSDDKSLNMLRLELEQVRSALDTLAREETVQSVDRRWDDFDQRWSAFENRITSANTDDPAIAALSARLEQICEAVNNLPESLSLRSLEEKVRTLASAVHHFVRQTEHSDTGMLRLIDERLDEISRAIVASTATARLAEFDPEPFERIEARISALARQIEEVAADNRPNAAVMDRLNALSQRVDEITAQVHMPQEAVERLATQIAIIADKIDRAPPAPDTDFIFQGIEQRFELFANVIERRQGDAIDQGNMLFRDLERRLDEVAERIDQRASAATIDNTGIMQAIDARFASLADRIESRPDTTDQDAIRSLEARLESISNRLDFSASQFTGIDPDLIRNLEAQVAGLTEHLARPSSLLPEFEDLGPRLDDIEKSIAGSHDTILEAARQAAENAVRSLEESHTHNDAVSGLAQDLKTLETLTRRSDERNSKTFEAIHDTLLKIVDRLGSLEKGEEPAAPQAPRDPLRKMALQDTPSLDLDEPLPLGGEEAPVAALARTPAQAAAEAAFAALDSDMAADSEPVARNSSVLGGLTRVFSGRKGRETTQLAGSPASVPVPEAPSVDLDEPLDPKIANRPLEPGSGAPDLNAIMKRVRAERGQPAQQGENEAAKSDFIAAARRAAQAAAAEAETLKRQSDIKGPVRALRIGDLLKARRKPVLMAAAAIMLALAGLQLGKAFMADSDETASNASATVAAEQDMQAFAAELPEISVDPEVAANPVAAAPDAAALIVPQPPEEAGPTMTETPEAMEEETAALQPQAEAGTISAASAQTFPEASDAPEASTIEVPANAGPVALREAASAGDAKALFEIGSRYAEGRGVAADMAAAATWYEKAAELGFAPAQYRLGNFYEKGTGVDLDLGKARTWYQLAANQGNASAMHNLAVLFAMGADGMTDNESAARWFIQAAELGVKDSQFNLGILSAKGVGMTQNLEDSYKWFALVAKTGDKDATAKRDEIANALRPEQLERARAATELWKPKPLDTAANSIDIPDAWQESPTTTAGIDMKKAVGNIQAILNKNGYDAGQPDGVIGQKTKKAIAAFQKDNAMPATGEIDEKLVRALLSRK